MEFFEFVLVISLTVGLPITILKMVMDYKKARLESERGIGEGGGVTAGELKRMLAEVVREANAPLVERIEALEHGPEALPSGREELPSSPDALYAEDEMDLEDEAEKTLGRRLRG